MHERNLEREAQSKDMREAKAERLRERVENEGAKSDPLAPSEAREISEDVYKRPEERQGSTNYRPATNEELLAKGLNPDSFVDDGSGFKSGLYVSGDNPEKVVLAFAGTDGSGEGFSGFVEDVWADIANGLGFSTAQYEQAAKLAECVEAAYGKNNMTTTGHSLGGGLAATASAVTGAPGVTFNAAVVSNSVLTRFGAQPDSAFSLVRNHTTGRDFLTALQHSVGMRESATPVPSGSMGGHTIAGPNWNY